MNRSIAMIAALAMSGAAYGQCASATSASLKSQCDKPDSGATVMNAAYRGDWDAKKNIVETAAEAGQFNTLAAALEAADLVETLEGDGPFTVFAPTDAAFEKLDRSTLRMLLQPENKALLASILTYHVVPGKVTADKVVEMNGAVTVNGQRIEITVDDGEVLVDGAKVVKTDIAASNGVIHVIDSVILPATNDIIDTALSAGSFNTLAAALDAAGLIETLRGDGPFTVFAPTDAAFEKIPAKTLESLLKPENREKLTAILTYHVVPGRVYSDTVLAKKSFKTVQGGSVTASVKYGKPYINDARIVQTDIDTANGVIHVIDSVIMPKDD